MKDSICFEITKNPGALESVNGKVEALLEERHLPAKIVFAVQLALDEMVSNIIKFTTGASPESTICLLLDFSDAKLDLQINYEGDCFDPFSREEPDLDLPLEDRPIGGLGIHLTRKLMDECHHSYRGGRNILEMWKRIETNPKS